MLRYIKATLGVAALVAVTALLLPVLLLGAESPFLAHPHLLETCAADADVAPCAQLGWQLILQSLLSTQNRLTALWQTHALMTMGGGIVLVGFMLVLRQRPRVAGLLGAMVVLLLIAGFASVAELDRQTIVSIVAQAGRVTFTVGSAAALILGSLILFGMMLRGSSRNFTDAFVIRTAHSTYFPQSRGENTDLAEQNLIGDIDGDTGVVRVSRIHADDKTKGLEPPKNSLVRLTSFNQDQKSRKIKQRSIYRRWDTLDGFSADPVDIGDKRIPLRIESDVGPQKGERQFPLCVMHLQDRVKLFGDKRPRVSTVQRTKYKVPNDGRDFAVLRIERAAFWNWFHYVFNHTDPAVAWSFRVGLVVSLFLMIVQITFLEPILSADGFVLN